ncbi:MAG: hypothetical protein IT432_10620 [Phycisphaerales bacterium]|nr:hypothetical protein [Phycisphaerales bacterium]
MLSALMLAASMTGCELFGVVGTIYEENADHLVKSQYEGLKGKTYAVLVVSDRGIEADFPGLTAEITARINDRLADPANATGATGHIESKALLKYFFNHPETTTKPGGKLAEELGVDRIIRVDLYEFRINDPGNQYVWDGVSAATVGVIERESITPDEYAFRSTTRVTFPDKSGITQSDISGQVVMSALVKRITDRVTWLFHDHQEPIKITY